MTTSRTQWDRNAECFEAALNDVPLASLTIVFPRVLELFGDVAGKKILDFGCGPGRFARAFADLGAIVSAYDSSQPQLERAAAQNGNRNITYVSDAKNLLPNSFDFVLCFQVVVCNPLSDAQQLIANIYGKLAPRGKAALVNTNTDTLGTACSGTYSERPPDPYVGAAYRTHISSSKGEFDVTDYFYSPVQLRQLYEKSCFKVLQEETPTGHFVLHLLEK